MRLPANGSSRCSSSMRRHQPQVCFAERLGLVVQAHRLMPTSRPGASREARACGRSSSCARRSALVSAHSGKSFSSASWPILACSALRSTSGSLGTGAPPNTSAARSQQLSSPVADLVRCTSYFCDDLGNRLVASDSVQRHLGLEHRCVVATVSLAHALCSCHAGLCPRPLEQPIHLSPCSDLRGHFEIEHAPDWLRPLRCCTERISERRASGVGYRWSQNSGSEIQGRGKSWLSSE